jgi:hypothetical protein
LAEFKNARLGRCENLRYHKTAIGTPGPSYEFSESHRGTRPYFFRTIGLGNRKGTDAMTRAERFITGIAIVSIIASLGYIALTLIG